MATNYELVFINNSKDMVDFTVFQEQPNTDVRSLAWMTKKTFPGATDTFSWDVDYSVQWSETQFLDRGVVVKSHAIVPAGLKEQNEVTLTNIGGAYKFIDQKTNPTADGSIHIKSDSTVKSNQASVGIGISGKGVFMVQTNPNVDHTFTPTTKYWIALGKFTEGEVLDTSSSNKAVLVDYPTNVYCMTAILNPDNTWDIKPS